MSWKISRVSFKRVWITSRGWPTTPSPYLEKFLDVSRNEFHGVINSRSKSVTRKHEEDLPNVSLGTTVRSETKIGSVPACEGVWLRGENHDPLWTRCLSSHSFEGYDYTLKRFTAFCNHVSYWLWKWVWRSTSNLDLPKRSRRKEKVIASPWMGTMLTVNVTSVGIFILWSSSLRQGNMVKSACSSLNADGLEAHGSPALKVWVITQWVAFSTLCTCLLERLTWCFLTWEFLFSFLFTTPRKVILHLF